ncbi:MAG TPA: tetratricopeptide repeat protein [Caulobacteraceae bacterium]|nr:tetratricopeptide repeat protein [Caulobacteraceae bacterium]
MFGQFSLGLLGLSLLFSIALCVHVVRTNQQMYWLWIILMFQPLGGLVYLVAVVVPGVFGGTTARRLGQAARETLDPTREYRRAKALCDDAPTVANQMRLANAAAALGRHDEAEKLFGQALTGIHADDPALLLGRANALIELGRYGEALPLLDKLDEDAGHGRTPQAALALARTYEGLGRMSEAEPAYQWASERLPGLEGLARYAAFLARAGRKGEARDIVAEIDKRVERTRGAFRAEARAWRDLAAQAL